MTCLTTTSGSLVHRVTSSTYRGIIDGSDGLSASVWFDGLVDVEPPVPTASGATRHQVCLGLARADQNNLVYVCMRYNGDVTAKLVVEAKSGGIYTQLAVLEVDLDFDIVAGCSIDAMVSDHRLLARVQPNGPASLLRVLDLRIEPQYLALDRRAEWQSIVRTDNITCDITVDG